MKNLILCCLLITLIFSCSKETNEQYHLLPNAKETVDNYNSARPPSFQNAKYLIGEIFIREGAVFDDDQKIMYIGVGTEIFTIQIKKSENYSFPKGEVEVVYLEREFIINDLQSNKISFFSVDENLSEYTSKLNLKNKVNVIGLGQLYPGPEEGLSLREVEEPDAHCKCKVGGESESNCTSGGIGSSQCSTSCPSDDSECSTTCTQMFFACCYCS